MPKFILRGSRATIIVKADNEFSAGAQAANFNIGVVHEIREEKERGKTSRAKSEKTEVQARRTRDKVSVVPFQFPLELLSEKT